jgi:hypothetical protein
MIMARNGSHAARIGHDHEIRGLCMITRPAGVNGGAPVTGAEASLHDHVLLGVAGDA